MEKLKKGKRFDLEDFKQQFIGITKMGDVNKVLEKLPENVSKKIPSGAIDNKKINRTIAIINSMTTQERRHPDILKASRKRRIAAGSGTTVQEVNQLLKQYEQVNMMMKKFGKGGKIANIIQNFKHLLPGGGMGM